MYMTDYRILKNQGKLEEIMVSDHAKAMQQAKENMDELTRLRSPDAKGLNGDANKAMQQTGGIDATLQERGNRYGPFDGHAHVTQEIKKAMQRHSGWKRLNSSQVESLEMIAHKIGRIINGDPNYDDSWRDIAGYATLIEKQLTGQGK